jgi:hypothetical protein
MEANMTKKKRSSGAPATSKRPKLRPLGLAATKAEVAALNRGNKINKMESKQDKELIKKKSGGALKSVPAGSKGLSKLPTKVRNNMGYMKSGGEVKKMGDGGMCRGMGAATKGGGFKKMG